MAGTQKSHSVTQQAYTGFKSQLNAFGYSWTIQNSADPAKSALLGFQPNVLLLPQSGLIGGPSAHNGTDYAHYVYNGVVYPVVGGIVTSDGSNSQKLSEMAGWLCSRLTLGVEAGLGRSICWA